MISRSDMAKDSGYNKWTETSRVIVACHGHVSLYQICETYSTGKKRNRYLLTEGVEERFVSKKDGMSMIDRARRQVTLEDYINGIERRG